MYFQSTWPFLQPHAHTAIFTLISCIVYQSALPEIANCCTWSPRDGKTIPIFISQPDFKKGTFKGTFVSNKRSIVCCLHPRQSFNWSGFVSASLAQAKAADVQFPDAIFIPYRPCVPMSTLISVIFLLVCLCTESITYGWRHAGGYKPQTIGMHRCTHPPTPFQALSNERVVLVPQATQDYKWVLCSTLHFIGLSLGNQQVNMLVASFIWWLIQYQVSPNGSW